MWNNLTPSKRECAFAVQILGNAGLRPKPRWIAWTEFLNGPGLTRTNVRHCWQAHPLSSACSRNRHAAGVTSLAHRVVCDSKTRRGPAARRASRFHLIQLLSEIFHQNKVASALVDLRVQDPALIGRDRYGTAVPIDIRPLWEFIQSRRASVAEVVKLHDGVHGILPIDEANAVPRHPPNAPTGFIGNLGFFAAFHRNAPDTRTLVLGVKKQFAIHRLKGLAATSFGDLNSVAALRARFPDLPLPTAIGAEVNPLPVARPARADTIRAALGQLPRSAAVGAGYEDVSVAGLGRIESDPPAVGRPARASRNRTTEGG